MTQKDDLAMEVHGDWRDDTSDCGYRCHQCQSVFLDAEIEAGSYIPLRVRFECHRCGYVEGVER